jgi:vacuolar-type H+-ATPase subunit I/STV1
MGIFGVLLATVGLVIKRTVGTASVIFGTVLLAIGLFASFYHVIHTVGQPPEAVILQIVYPFESVGIILLAAGVIFIALGLLHPPLKDNHIGIRIRETS